METPFISVIIPNYNHGSWLSRRIQSVLDQSFCDIELIILDDASSDNSREMIEGFRGNPLIRHIIYNESNSGNPFVQWQRGVALARGKWIWIAESDDEADTRFLEKLVNAIRGKENVGLVYCDSGVLIGEKLSEETFAARKNSTFLTDRWSYGYANNGQDEIENFLLPGGTINNTSAVLFNHEVLLRVNPFEIYLRYIGDKFAFIKVLKDTDVVYVAEVLNAFRNPFNDKHADKYVMYFYEQFLIFDWVLKNIRLRDRKSFYRGFYTNTRNSLFRGWNREKLRLYFHLLRSNPELMVRSIWYNLIQGIHSVFSNTKPKLP